MIGTKKSTLCWVYSYVEFHAILHKFEEEAALKISTNTQEMVPIYPKYCLLHAIYSVSHLLDRIWTPCGEDNKRFEGRKDPLFGYREEVFLKQTIIVIGADVPYMYDNCSQCWSEGVTFANNRRRNVAHINLTRLTSAGPNSSLRRQVSPRWKLTIS